MSKKQAEVSNGDLISTAEAASLAGVNVKTIVRWFDAGKIGGQIVPMGSHSMRRVSRVSLEAWLASDEKRDDQAPA